MVLLTKCCRVVCDAEDFDVGSGVAVHSAEAAKSKDYMNAWGQTALPITITALNEFTMSRTKVG